MKFRLLTILFLFGALAQVRAQGNSIYSIAPMAVCWNTPENVDSNLIAYWLFSSRETTPKVVSYLTASGTAVVVAGGTIQNGFCCCNSSQDTIGITINGDTLILVQNGITYTYIGGAGDDDWRWVDPGAGETMYEAIYRMGKASIFTTDTSFAFQVDSTYRFRTDNNTSILQWMRGNESLVDYKTLLFRAPGGATGSPQNDANNITIARTNATTTRTNLGSLKFAAPYTGGAGAYRVGAQISALDELGGNDTTGVVLDFWTRQQGESFIRNTMTLEGDGRLELDRYNLFEDGVPERMLGYDDTDKDVKVSDITGNPQPGNVLGIDAIGTGMQWLDPDTLGANVNIYNSNGSIPAATNRVVTVPTDGNVSFVRGLHTLGYQTTGLGAGTGQGWASKYFNTSTNYSEVFSGIQGVNPRAGALVVSGTTRTQVNMSNTTAFMEARNTGTNNGTSINCTTVEANMTQFTSGSAVRALAIGSGFIYAWDTNPANTVIYPSLRPGANSFWRYNADGTGQYVTASSLGATDLTFTGASSPVTLNSSTGTDVTLTAGTGVTFSQAGNNLTINAPAASTANLTVSGTTPNFTISAGGTTMGIVAGNGMDGSVGSNILTLNGLRSGTVNASTQWTLLGQLNIVNSGGVGLTLNNSGVYSLGDVSSVSASRFAVTPATGIFAFGAPSGAGGQPLLRIHGDDSGDFVQLTVSNNNFLSYTLTFPENGDGSEAGTVITNLGGGVTTFAHPPVYMTWTHTSFQEVPITNVGIGAVVIPPDLDGYTITEASYRSGSVISDFDMPIELAKTTISGTVTSSFLTGTILESTRYISTTTAPMTVAEGDLIQSLVSGLAGGEGLTVTIKLEKN